MKTKNQLNKNKKKSALFFTYIAIIALLFVIIGIVISCSNSKTNSYNIVKISGEEAFLYNMSKSSNGYITFADSSMSSAMLMEDGDLIAINFYFYDLYQNSNTKEYIIEGDQSLLYINRKLSSIIISQENDVILRQMNDSDIKELRSLVFEKEIPKEYLPFIEKIALNNKDIGLDFRHVYELSPSIIKMFNPSWMSIGGISQQDFNLLIGLNYTRTLWLNSSDTVISEPLPNMPQLKQIILSDVDIHDDIIEDFLGNNPQIEKVVLAEGNSSALSMIKNLKNLKSLSIVTDSKVLNLENLNTCKQLEVLNLVLGKVEKIENIEVLNELSSLRWLTLPAAITQDEFNSIINNHKDLEVLEMLGCKKVNNLKAITNLESLYGLVITDALYDKVTPKLLNQLRFLSLPKETFNDTTYVASLKKSLPECTIVPNDGFCLGSGWLFLLFPLIILFVIIRRKCLLRENI
ncbi:hypothetical protein ACFLQ5_03820 [Bacteroidota bacterium]